MLISWMEVNQVNRFLETGNLLIQFMLISILRSWQCSNSIYAN